jgi:next-to-BRCA1 protein 1
VLPACPSYTSPAPAAGIQASSTSYSEQPIFPASVAEIQRGFEELLINQTRFSPSRETPTLSKHQVVPETSSCSSTEIPVIRGAAAPDSWFGELCGVSQERQNSIRNNTGFPAPTVSIFSVYCNNCDGAILDEHYHCSTCDDGDFDLCPSCVEDGVSCNDGEHWMIKRFVKNGKVINSTTETIAPKPAGSQSKTTLVALEEENAAVATRTCNSCIQGKLQRYPGAFLLANTSHRTLRGELRHLHVLPGL